MEAPILFLDLTTGEASLAKMPDQQQLEYGEELLPYIVTGVWDPVEPAYLYAMIPERIIDDDIACSVWRIHVETLVGTPNTPVRHQVTCGISRRTGDTCFSIAGTTMTPTNPAAIPWRRTRGRRYQKRTYRMSAGAPMLPTESCSPGLHPLRGRLLSSPSGIYRPTARPWSSMRIKPCSLFRMERTLISVVRPDGYRILLNC